MSVAIDKTGFPHIAETDAEAIAKALQANEGY